jgi:hypothetical protein
VAGLGSVAIGVAAARLAGFAEIGRTGKRDFDKTEMSLSVSKVHRKLP